MMASYLTAHGDTKESVIFAFHVRCGSINLSSFHFVKLHDGIIICMYRYVEVKFLYKVIFIFLLFLGMVMYTNEVKTKEK